VNADANPASGPGGVDPVRVRREKVAKWSLLANRIGYLLFAVAISLFVLAFVFGFKAPLVTAIVVCMAVGSALLAPAIVLGYAVKAAEKEDRAAGR
jgi:hypothetical protein